MRVVLVFLLLFAVAARTADNFHNVTAKSDVFWQLADLDSRAPEKSGNVYLGAQNYTWCCLKAVEVGLELLTNGTLIVANKSITKISVSITGDLRSAANKGQFPCGAKYNKASGKADHVPRSLVPSGQHYEFVLFPNASPDIPAEVSVALEYCDENLEAF
ncbi:hypothetical protein BDP55DRAFT_636012 [Colletotrichum godetiae]|uniref:Uncharacterized protein n=1 Tax=Colletotrichum godetiae TaxID=1209918 RepID=A0AAJ0EQ32_9PEZI|nr:uncharacterized protein BDP55DRAFT_636012 [Colletotrichum godetiae]KAK1671167.1 hypothetical protein BDP55DRAFT_636012 [Colletotrichum godetiae]